MAGEGKNKKMAERTMKNSKQGVIDAAERAFTKVLPQVPLHSDDAKDKACGAPKSFLRQPHLNEGGRYPKDNAKCPEGCRKIGKTELEELVKTHLPKTGMQFVDICVSKESKYSWK